MEQDFELGDISLQPTVHIYASLILTLAHSWDKHKARKAYAILSNMHHLYENGLNTLSKSNVYTYNAVLNACAYTHGYEENTNDAFKIACKTFDRIQKNEYDKPNHITYGTFLKVCLILLPDLDTQKTIINALFKKNCLEGQLGEVVLRQLRASASQNMIHDLLTPGINGEDELVSDLTNIRTGDSPKNWSRNVREKKGRWRDSTTISLI